MVNLRVVARGARVHPKLVRSSRLGHADALARQAVRCTSPTRPSSAAGLRARSGWAIGQRVEGPAVIEETTLTSAAVAGRRGDRRRRRRSW